MPSDQKLLRELRKQLEEERKHREELLRELRRSRETDDPPSPLQRMRDAYAEGDDPDALRAKRRGKKEAAK